MKEHVKNQHYIPQFLLRNFSSRDNKFIWCFDKVAYEKKWNFIKERPIRNVASEKFLYDESENSKSGSYEYKLGKIEDGVAPIIEKLVESKDLTRLSVDEKFKIAYFVIIQLFRTKSHFFQTTEILNKLVSMIEQFEPVTEEIDSKKAWLPLLDDAKGFIPALMNKVWNLGISKNKFFISDNPVVMRNSEDVGPERCNLGINRKGIEIYLPLSSSVMLSMVCEKKIKETTGYIGQYLPNIECINKWIDAFNAMQFLSSERFLFSNANNFETILDLSN